MADATHKVKILGYIVRPPYIPKKDKAGIRNWLFGVLEGKIPQLDLVNIEIEELVK